MNREIKFRGKRLYDNDCNKTKNGEWAFGYLTECFDGKKAIFKPYKSYLSPAEKHRVDESTIGQFTGLRDKKGNDIFEGDIVHFVNPGLRYDLTAPVIFEHGDFCLEKDRNYLIPMGNFEDACYEVVGNIFDNPELLKGGAE